jgi:hypothetical protein
LDHRGQESLRPNYLLLGRLAREDNGGYF